MNLVQEPVTTEQRIKIALEALSRVDNSIRYSESKTGFLVAFIGLSLGLLRDRLATLQLALASGGEQLSALTILALLLIVLGAAVALTSAIQVVYARLKVNTKPSFMFFGTVAAIEEANFVQQYMNLSSDELSEQILTQVHASSVIASHKFRYAQRMTAGTVVYSIGAALAVIVGFALKP